jgi:hypothetical protein
VLAPAATAFVQRLHRELNPERERLLAARESTKGLRPRFVPAPEHFTVAPAAADLQDRVGGAGSRSHAAAAVLVVVVDRVRSLRGGVPCRTAYGG